MPLTRVAMRKGKPAPYKKAILKEIYEAMRETCHIGEGDMFMAITEHDEADFAYGKNYLGIQRSDDLLQIHIFWSPGKGPEMKQALYKKIVERLGTDPGVRSEDFLYCNL